MVAVITADPRRIYGPAGGNAFRAACLCVGARPRLSSLASVPAPRPPVAWRWTAGWPGDGRGRCPRRSRRTRPRPSAMAVHEQRRPTARPGSRRLPCPICAHVPGKPASSGRRMQSHSGRPQARDQGSGWPGTGGSAPRPCRTDDRVCPASGRAGPTLGSGRALDPTALRIGQAAGRAERGNAWTGGPARHGGLRTAVHQGIGRAAAGRLAWVRGGC